MAHIGFDTPLIIHQPYKDVEQIGIPTQIGTWYYFVFESLTTADWELYDNNGLVAHWQGQRKLAFNLKAQSNSYLLCVRNKERLPPIDLTKNALIMASSEFDEHHKAENAVRHPGREWAIKATYGIIGQWIKVDWGIEAPVMTIFLQSRLSERDPALKKACFLFSNGEEFEITFPYSRRIQEVNFNPSVKSRFVKIVIEDVYPAETPNVGLRYLKVYGYPEEMRDSNLSIYVIPGSITQACCGLLVTALGLAIGVIGIVYFALPRRLKES